MWTDEGERIWRESLATTTITDPPYGAVLSFHWRAVEADGSRCSVCDEPVYLSPMWRVRVKSKRTGQTFGLLKLQVCGGCKSSS
jgi:hypothetical protein